MKPHNAIYIGSPPLDLPEDDVVIWCTHCRVNWFGTEWKRNHGHCPGCQREFAGELRED